MTKNFGTRPDEPIPRGTQTLAQGPADRQRCSPRIDDIEGRRRRNGPRPVEHTPDDSAAGADGLLTPRSRPENFAAGRRSSRMASLRSIRIRLYR